MSQEHLRRQFKRASSAEGQRSQRGLGYIIIGIGGIVTLWAFFFLPYLSLGFLGSLSGSQLANMNNQFIQGTWLLWLEPLISVIIIGIAGYQLFRGQRHDDGAAALIVIGLSILTLMTLLIKYIGDARPLVQTPYGDFGPTLASLYSSGFWLSTIAMIAVIVGGVVQLRAIPKRMR